MKTLLKSTFTFFFIVTLAGCDWFDSYERLLEDSEVAKYKSVQATLYSLEQTNNLKYATGLLSINSQTIKDHLSILDGVAIKLVDNSFGDLKGTTLTVNSITSIPKDGFTKINVTAEIEWPDKDLTIGLNLSGLLTFDGYNHTKDKNEAIFKIILTKVETAFNWKFLFLDLPTVIDETVTAAINDEFKDFLKIAIPTAYDSHYTLGTSAKQEHISLDKNDKEIGKAQINIQLPESEINYGVKFLLPIFHSKGVIIAATKSDVVVPSMSTDISKLPTLLKTARNELNKYVYNLPFIDNSIAVGFNLGELSAIPSLVNNLSKPKRTVTAKVSSYSGNLHLERSGSAPLEQEYRASFRGKSPVSVDATLGDLKFNRVKNGLSFNAPININATVSIKAHIDPGPGGGFGKNLSIRGKTKADVSGQLSFQTVIVNKMQTIILKTELQCNQIEVEAIDAGELKVGMRTYQLIGDQPLPSTPILIDGTYYSTPELDEEEGKVKLTVPFKSIGFTVKTLPVIDYGDLTILAANTSVSVHQEVRNNDEIEATFDNINKSLLSIANSNAGKGCPPLKSSEFLIAGQAFGENNEFLKLAANVTKEWEKIKTNPVEAAKDLPGNVVKEGERVLKKIEKILPKVTISCCKIKW
jgi:hypothetical protein